MPLVILQYLYSLQIKGDSQKDMPVFSIFIVHSLHLLGLCLCLFVLFTALPS
jgi:hypothetical protein